MNQMLQGLLNVVCYLDDILITGITNVNIGKMLNGCFKRYKIEVLE